MEARALRYAYDAGSPAVLDGVDLRIDRGELVGLVGPNGAGKSTLLKVLLGLLPPSAGTITLSGEPLASLPRRRVARLAAFVPQGFESSFAFRVREMVAMGRTPWLGRFQPEGPEDRRIIDEALAAADVADLAERPFPELSGGERQRVLLARAFAQTTPVLLLDEPTSSLDLKHAYELLALVRERVRGGAAAVVALHDLSLSARFCDRLVVLHGRGVAADGPPARVLTSELMARAFGVRARVRTTDAGVTLLEVDGPIS